MNYVKGFKRSMVISYKVSKQVLHFTRDSDKIVDIIL